MDEQATDTETPNPQWPDDAGECVGCGKKKERVLRRLNVSGAPKLCDTCHDERSKR